MSRLLKAELSRLTSRRLTWVAVILIALAVGLMQLAVFYSVKPLSAAELAEGQAQYQQAQQEYEANRADNEAQEKECLAQGQPAEACSYKPTPENYASRSVTTFADITNAGVTVSVFVSTLAFLFVGASFIGAEYSSGSLGNWLSFIPERGKVFASKLLALVLVAAVVSALASAVMIGLSALVSRTQGASVSGVGALFEMSGRGIAITVIGAVLGFALALLTRHTIAAAGVLLGYLFLAFVLRLLTFSIQSLQGLVRWLPENNLLAVLNHGYKYTVETTTITDQGVQPDYVERTLSLAHGATYWSVILVVVIALTFLLFPRRDIN